MKRVGIIASFLFLFFSSVSSQNVSWPKIVTEARPALRWWWIESAVNKEGIAESLRACAAAGIGTIEITPVEGEEESGAGFIEFLSPKWMEMFQYVQSESKRLGIKVAMDLGTGFSLGGPETKIEDAGNKVFFQEYRLKTGEKLKNTLGIDKEEQKKYATLNCLMAFSDSGERLDITGKVDKKGNLNWTAPKGDWRLIAVFCGKTFEKVRGAAPGGEGYVVNCFSRKAVTSYLERLDKAFNTRLGEYAFKAVTDYYRGINENIEQGRVSYPAYFIGYGWKNSETDWTPDFLQQFVLRRGYKLENYLPELLDNVSNKQTTRLISDYQKTLEEIYQDNFVDVYTAWAHTHGCGSLYRQNISEGARDNFLAMTNGSVCETVTGRKKIRGKETIVFTDMDSLRLKWTSSAAHLAGKPYARAEIFSGLEQPFYFSLSQCKPLIDEMFVSGINRVSINGMCYSPVNEKWPGWQYQQGIALSPRNSIWRDASAFFEYISRCQSFLQAGNSDNEFLIYLSDTDRELSQPTGNFTEYTSKKYIPGRWKRAIEEMENNGYKADGISDNFILSSRCINGKIVTREGAAYRAVIIPGEVSMPAEVLSQLIKFVQQGAKIIFINSYPENSVESEATEKTLKEWETLMKKLPEPENFKKMKRTVLGKGEIITGNNYTRALKQVGRYAEEMSLYGIRWVRRMDKEGFCYFLTSPKTRIKEWITLGVNAMSAAIYDPVTGESGKAKIKYEKGRTKIWLDIWPGQSFIVKTWNRADIEMASWKYMSPQPVALSLDNGWKLRFVSSSPQIDGSYFIDHPVAWTDLSIPEVTHTMGTGVYSLIFNLPEVQAHDWILDLGEIHESARIRVNDQEVGTMWSFPFKLSVGRYLRPGSNQIDIEVTNMPVNKLALYRQQGIRWYLTGEDDGKEQQHLIYKSGLTGIVKLIPMNYE